MVATAGPVRRCQEHTPDLAACGTDATEAFAGAVFVPNASDEYRTTLAELRKSGTPLAGNPAKEVTTHPGRYSVVVLNGQAWVATFWRLVNLGDYHTARRRMPELFR